MVSANPTDPPATNAALPSIQTQNSTLSENKFLLHWGKRFVWEAKGWWEGCKALCAFFQSSALCQWRQWCHDTTAASYLGGERHPGPYKVSKIRLFCSLSNTPCSSQMTSQAEGWSSSQQHVASFGFRLISFSPAQFPKYSLCSSTVPSTFCTKDLCCLPVLPWAHLFPVEGARSHKRWGFELLLCHMCSSGSLLPFVEGHPSPDQSFFVSYCKVGIQEFKQKVETVGVESLLGWDKGCGQSDLYECVSCLHHFSGSA